MKRDMDLIRKMVLAVEDSPSGFAPDALNFDDYTEEQVGYHAYLLVDAGLALGADVTTMSSSSPEYVLRRLTWAGHEFADACRNESIWNQAQDTVKKKAGSVTFDVLKELLVSLLRGVIGIA
ncbi:MAG: DUF2513 domain-containing protein [Pirellulales bacterium]|nr:DUF2513 domain-containing protein [Pirellulales bacterium]